MRRRRSSAMRSSRSSSSRRSSAACAASRRAIASSGLHSRSPLQAQRRSSSGSVRPWPTSVIAITPTVTKISRSRCANARRVEHRGSASAAASEIAPRIPLQPTTRRSRQSSPVSARAQRRHDARRAAARTRLPRQPHADHDEADDDDVDEQRAVVARLAHALEDALELQPEQHEQRRVEAEHEHLPERDARSGACRRRTSRAQCQPNQTPAVTVASTPETPSCSAPMYAP